MWRPRGKKRFLLRYLCFRSLFSPLKIRVKSGYKPSGPSVPEPIPAFCSVMLLAIFLLPPGSDASLPPAFNSSLTIYTPGGKRHCKGRVSCLVSQAKLESRLLDPGTSALTLRPLRYWAPAKKRSSELDSLLALVATVTLTVIFAR